MEFFLGVVGFFVFLILVFVLDRIFDKVVFFEKSWSKKFLAAAIFGFILFFSLTKDQISLEQKIGVSIVALIVLFALNLKINKKETIKKE